MGKWSKHGSLFELGTRVPLIVAVPGGKSAGKFAPNPVQSLDVYPTLCELTGVKPPAGLEGRSLTPLLADPSAAWDHPAVSVFGNKKKFGVAVRTPTHRYVEYDNGSGGAMLFDVRADPQETKNLAADPAHAGVRDELAKVARRHAPDRGQ
jgi:arylsulfatase A-like enzyme